MAKKDGDTFTFIETVDSIQKSQNICVRPYFDPNRDNMGLEKYEMVLFEGVFHEEQLAQLDKNGVKRYLTGLNEFAPEIKLITDPEKRAAKTKEIRVKVSQLEKELASNVIDPNDTEFWNKVSMLRPDNDEFWSRITMRCGNEPVPLDPVKDPFDLIKVSAIEAGGFPMIAPSLETARSMSVSPKFYLDKTIETISTKTELTKLRNKALVELQLLYDTNMDKLFYVAKVVDGNSAQYKKTTPNDIVYDNMDKYITGKGIETNLKRAAQTFLDTCRLDMETVKIRSIVKDSTFYKLIATKSDGFIYHIETGSMLGRNVSDCVEYLKDPLNDKILSDLIKKCEKYWNM